MPRDLEDLRATVETWRDQRIPLAQGFTSDGLRAFAEAHNFHSRKLIALLQREDEAFYSALLELTQGALGQLAKAKLIVNHIDRTNV